MSEIKLVKIDLRKDAKLAKDLEEIRNFYRISDYANAVRIAIARTAQEIRIKKTTREVSG